MIYFNENGITATHAAHIKNICKELILQDQTKLDNINVVNSKISLIGTDKETTTSIGVTSLSFIDDSVEKICQASALGAWLGEAIKEKENLLEKIENMSISQYCLITKQEDFCYPTLIKIKEEDIISEMSSEHRAKYLCLEASAAQIGKIIHPHGNLSKIRKEAGKIAEIPSITNGTGRDLTITTRELSVPFDDIDIVYFDLQNKHRKYQSLLNKMKSDIKKIVDTRNLELNQKYSVKLSEYSIKSKKLEQEFQAYVISERKNISDLRILIPEDLKEFYAYVNSIGE